jgi:hypothetical protein
MVRRSDGSCIVKSALTERAWTKRLPSAVVGARPAHCVRCRRGAFEDGRVSIHSHGKRLRHQIGPVEYGQSVERRVDVARRFRCERSGCGTVMLVVPRSVVPKKQYSVGAIASAVAIWNGYRAPTPAVDAESEQTVRPSSRWRQPEQWAADVFSERLFEAVPRHPSARQHPREAAKALVQSIAGRAQRGTQFEALVFAGAEHLP